MQFVLDELADLNGVADLPGHEESTPELVAAILEEANKLASEVLAPLNRVGDQQGSRIVDGTVVTPEGWKEAYKMFCDGGWNSLPFDPQFGGQGLPWLVSTVVQEMWHSANMAFGLCPMLTQSAAEAISRHASDNLKKLYLPKLVSGEWTGTMNLTEPQAGSDLSAIRTQAIPHQDHYLLRGQKIFITYGDHDLSENIVHMVLARTPDAPEGVKGISLFLVPKFVVDSDGNIGKRNDLTTVSLEHKLGIHASPTAVLSYGDNDGAVGYLVGQENMGLTYMFIMMNLARHVVGVEGLSIAERAYQQAVAYAKQRVQGRLAGDEFSERATIINHPDVQRMLLQMKANIEALRSLAYTNAAALDKSLCHHEPDERQRNHELLEFLTPIVKGWCTEVGNWVASLGIQVHGGVGYIEETGAAQHYRDARITNIYEGTTGIQAMDFVGRKVLRNGGEVAYRMIETMETFNKSISADSSRELEDIGDALQYGIESLRDSTNWLLDASQTDPNFSAAAATNFLSLWGVVIGGWLMARSAFISSEKLKIGSGDAKFYRDKIFTSRFYALQVMPTARAYCSALIDGTSAAVVSQPEEFFKAN